MTPTRGEMEVAIVRLLGDEEARRLLAYRGSQRATSMTWERGDRSPRRNIPPMGRRSVSYKGLEQ